MERFNKDMRQRALGIFYVEARPAPGSPSTAEQLSSFFSSWLKLVRLYSLYEILQPKGGYNLTLYWVP